MDDREITALPTPSGGEKDEHWNQPLPSPLSEAVEDALNQIELRLRQMLALARLSASDSDVDRQVLQKKLEWLRIEIDRIADEIDRIADEIEHG